MEIQNCATKPVRVLIHALAALTTGCSCRGQDILDGYNGTDMKCAPKPCIAMLGLSLGARHFQTDFSTLNVIMTLNFEFPSPLLNVIHTKTISIDTEIMVLTHNIM